MQLPGIEWIEGGHTEASVFVFRFDTTLFRRARWPSQKIRRFTPSGLVALGTPKVDEGHVVACFGEEVRSSTAHGMLRALLKAFGLDPRAVTDPEALDVVHLQHWGAIDAAERAERALEELEAREDGDEGSRFSMVLLEDAPPPPEPPLGDGGYLLEQLHAQSLRSMALEGLRQRYAREVVTWHFGAPSLLRAYKKPKMPLERRAEFVRLREPRADLVTFAWQYRYLVELNGACFVGRNFRASLLSAFQIFTEQKRHPALTDIEERLLREILSGVSRVTCAVCAGPARTGDDVCSDACAEEICDNCCSVIERRSSALPCQMLQETRARDAEIARLRFDLSLDESRPCTHLVSRGTCDRGCRFDYVDACCDSCLVELGRRYDVEAARRRFQKRPGLRQQLEAKLQRLLDAPSSEAPAAVVQVKVCAKCGVEEREGKRRPAKSSALKR